MPHANGMINNDKPSIKPMGTTITRKTAFFTTHLPFRVEVLPVRVDDPRVDKTPMTIRG